MADRNDPEAQQREARERVQKMADAMSAMEAADTGRAPQFLEAVDALDPFVPSGVDPVAYRQISAAVTEAIVDKDTDVATPLPTPPRQDELPPPPERSLPPNVTGAIIPPIAPAKPEVAEVMPLPDLPPMVFDGGNFQLPDDAAPEAPMPPDGPEPMDRLANEDPLPLPDPEPLDNQPPLPPDPPPIDASDDVVIVAPTFTGSENQPISATAPQQQSPAAASPTVASPSVPRSQPLSNLGRPGSGVQRPPGQEPPMKGQTRATEPPPVKGNFGETSPDQPPPQNTPNEIGMTTALGDMEYAMTQWTYKLMDTVGRVTSMLQRHDSYLSRTQDRLDTEDTPDEW